MLLRELRERGYTGGITILRELVARTKARHVGRLGDRFETEPGLQAQVDWGSCGTIRHRGRRRRPACFRSTAALASSSASRRRFRVEPGAGRREHLVQSFADDDTPGGVAGNAGAEASPSTLRRLSTADRPPIALVFASACREEIAMEPMVQPTHDPATYTVNTFCEEHHTSRSYLYRLWNEGRGPRRTKIGRRTLITREAAAQWRRWMEEETERQELVAAGY